jgi:hypothetical protein
MMHRMMLAFVLIGAAAGADAPDWRKADLKDVALEFRLVQDVDEIERLLGVRDKKVRRMGFARSGALCRAYIIRSVEEVTHVYVARSP